MLDLCLAILIDASGSVDAAEYKLQVEGTAKAISHPETVARIASQGGMAVRADHFSGGVAELVPWITVVDQASANAFAAALIASNRTETGSTAAGDGILHSVLQMERAPACLRKVIDISADGWTNSGAMVDEAITAAQSKDIIVNSIIIPDETDVLEKYKAAVNGFTIEATWEGYEQAIKMKLNLEIARPLYWAPPLITPLERAYLADYYHYGPQYARVTWNYSELTPPVEASTSNTVPIENSIGLLGLGWWFLNRRKG